MKSYLHITIAASMTLLSVFFLYLWYQSGLNSCLYDAASGGSPLTCRFSAEESNYQFLSLGFLCASLAVVETIMAFEARRASIPESARQTKIRRTGLLLVLIGVPLMVYGLYMLNTTVVMCPANGCSPSALWAIYGPYDIAFLGGQFSIALGAFLILLSKFNLNAESKKEKEDGIAIFRGY